MLASRYRDELIMWKGGGRGQADQALSLARWIFERLHHIPCTQRKLYSTASFFYEIIKLHPLIDGNKRLATLLLDAVLIANGLCRPERIAEAALHVAAGEWGPEDVYHYLLKAQEGC